MEKFDLNEIKRKIEERYDVELKVEWYYDRYALMWNTKHEKVNVHLSNYTTLNERNGAEYVSVSYDNSKEWRGWGCPCDSVDEVLEQLNEVFPKKDCVQMSLF